MIALQIIGFIGLGIVLIGAIFLSKEWVKTGVTLAAIGAILGIIGAIGHQWELDKDIPTALDVYRGKTTLEITYRDSVAIDSTVVYKEKGVFSMNTEVMKMLYQDCEAFMEGIEFGKKEMIEKTYQWILCNMPKYVKANKLDVFINNEDMANDFKRAMEE